MTESAFLAAARRQQDDDRVPVWFMRQAGRSLPEYREVREGTTMLEACEMPELVREITLQPVRRHGVDAAVFYSDIMVPLKAAGYDLDIVPGRGPVVANPVTSERDVAQIPSLDRSQLEHITEAIGLLMGDLRTAGRDGEQVPLVGFAGAPFTLASYLIEGGPSRDYARTKALMVGNPELWHQLCTRLAAISTVFLKTQIAAGAEAVQLFDSWAGSLSDADYRTYVLPHSVEVLKAVSDVPRIHFGVGTAHLLQLIGSAGAEVVGVDWRIDLAQASKILGDSFAVQGNLDPALLGAPWPVLADRVREVLMSGASTPGHIFNLGHGVPPTADPQVLTRIVELVHQEGPALRQRAREQATV